MSRTKSEFSYSSFEKFAASLVEAPVKLSEVGKRIKEIRTEIGLTQPNFAEKISKTQNDISRFENGLRATESPDVFIEIARLDPHKRGLRWLLGGDKALQTTTRVSDTPAPFATEKGSEYAHVAALDCEVAAGPGRDLKITTSDKDEPHVRWVTMPKQSLGADAQFYRWLRVHGDSMEPAYPDKSWVLVNLLRHDPHTHKLVDKPVVVWLDRDKGCTLKILQESADERDFWILHAFNLRPRPIKKSAEHIQFAAVEAAWRKIG